MVWYLALTLQSRSPLSQGKASLGLLRAFWEAELLTTPEAALFVALRK